MAGFRLMGAVLFALALHCLPASAQNDSPVREMMAVSGMVEQFADLGENFRAGILQAAGQTAMPPDVVNDLADIASRQVDGTAYLRALEVGLEATLSADEIAAVTAFYSSPLGQRVKEAEVANSTIEAMTELESRREEIRAELDKDPRRLALAQALDEALLASELSATVAGAVARAMLVGAVEALPPSGNPEALAAIERQLESMHGQTVEQMREALLVTYAFMYRSISDDDFAAYAEFLKTDAARAAYAAVFEVTSNFMTERAQQIGKEFGALLRQKKT